MLDKILELSKTRRKMKKPKPNYRLGEVIQKFYDDLRMDKVTKEEYIPRSDLVYITSLLNHKFGKNYSFQEVNKLLKECLGTAIDG